jgi:hypothetical protein
LTVTFIVSVPALCAGSRLGRFAGTIRFTGRGACRCLADRTGARSRIRQGPLNSVTYKDPAALGSRDSATYKDQTPFHIYRHNGKILNRHSPITHVAGHFLALENPARILILTRRSVRSVRHRYTVRCPKTGEPMPFHRTGKSLTDRCACHIDKLAWNKMIRRQFVADIQQFVIANPKLADFPLWLDKSLRKMSAHRLANVLDLRFAGAELNSGIAVIVGTPDSDHLT